MLLENLRQEYHRTIFADLLSMDKDGVPNNADKHSTISVQLAKGIVSKIHFQSTATKQSGQSAGKSFEKLTAAYIQNCLNELKHLHTSQYDFFLSKSIAYFEQYEHLHILEAALKANRELRSVIGDYIVNPDIIIGRIPVKDDEINKHKNLIDENVANALFSPTRWANSQKPILHASISCKWTIRSDRSQNSRTEGLNLIRNRKGHTPHIVIVTAEPYPHRIASLALGTGDIDCVYHFALHELMQSVEELSNESVTDLMETLVQGKRLRDISDLPFDILY